ncbi:hypothetical protein C0991_009997, partial [Blastosporella zonata]
MVGWPVSAISRKSSTNISISFSVNSRLLDIYNALLVAKAWLGTDELYSQMLESAEMLLDKHNTTNLATAISTQPPSLVVTSRYSVRRVAQLMKEKAVSACVVEDQITDCTAPSLCTSKDLACYVAKYGS